MYFTVLLSPCDRTVSIISVTKSINMKLDCWRVEKVRSLPWLWQFFNKQLINYNSSRFSALKLDLGLLEFWDVAGGELSTTVPLSGTILLRRWRGVRL